MLFFMTVIVFMLLWMDYEYLLLFFISLFIFLFIRKKLYDSDTIQFIPLNNLRYGFNFQNNDCMNHLTSTSHPLDGCCFPITFILSSLNYVFVPHSCMYTMKKNVGEKA